MRTLFNFTWSDFRYGLASAAVLSVAAGLASAWVTPRGPVTTTQALATMAAAILIGMMAGLTSASRWSMLATPVVFIITFEFARRGIEGPTVDAIHLGSTYGLIAFIVGRLFHGVIVLVPMILGTRYGESIAAALGNQAAKALTLSGWIFSSLVAVAWIVLAIFLARPASTPPIMGSDGEPVPGSIAELISVPIGGHQQVMMIRGRNVENPVLLYLAGGPGGTDLGAMRADVGLEQHFVVATWEQRGAGKSYSVLDPAATLTVNQMVSDTIEVTNYLRDRFDQEKIYLVGNSWGTILGALVVQQRPDLYHAYVGTGQMVSPRETDVMFYQDTLAWAEETGNDKLASVLRQNGPPPYENLLDYESAISHEHDWNPYPSLDTSKEMPGNLFVPENDLMDRFNGLRAFLDTFSILYPQLQQVDLRQDAPILKVPVTIVMGKYEARGRAVLAEDWYEMLEAPFKELIVFDHSGHRPLFEEPAAFVEVMKKVLEDHPLNAANQ